MAGEMTVDDLMDRLAMLPDEEFWPAWRALGTAIKAALRLPPPPRSLVQFGEFCELPEAPDGR